MIIVLNVIELWTLTIKIILQFTANFKNCSTSEILTSNVETLSRELKQNNEHAGTINLLSYFSTNTFLSPGSFGLRRQCLHFKKQKSLPLHLHIISLYNFLLERQFRLSALSRESSRLKEKRCRGSKKCIINSCELHILDIVLRYSLFEGFISKIRQPKIYLCNKNAQKILKLLESSNSPCGNCRTFESMFDCQDNPSTQAQSDQCESSIQQFRKKRTNFKTEVQTPVVQRPHRKSDRRRVARDIFLVFEEHPGNRRSRKRSASKRKPSGIRSKSKFGHLSTVDIKSRIRNTTKKASNNVLLKVKTERNVNRKKTSCKIINEKLKEVTESVPLANSNHQVARVNPIFLWVKQDGTRIVEVRCEDYDKRNRIRITKTTNGWRAIPRTDPSSRVVTIVSNPGTNIKKEKQELILTPVTNEKNNESLTGEKGANEECWEKRKKKKKKKQKAKESHHKHTKIHYDNVEELVTISQKNMHAPLFALNDPKEIVGLNKEKYTKQNEKMPKYQTELQRNVNCANEVPKNLTYVSDAQKLDISVEVPPNKSLFQLCPQTGLFVSQGETLENKLQEIEFAKKDMDHPLNHSPVNAESEIRSERVGISLLSNCFDQSDTETKNLKELLDDADLLQNCSDNAMSGADLIDSLVKRSCEVNHISDHEMIKKPVGLEDFDNEEDDVLIQQGPIVDIITRLPESLSASPKCLSFNEAGEIEGIHGEIFQTTIQTDPFNRSILDDISITIKDFDPSSEVFVNPVIEKSLKSAVVSPDSCADELPKDLTCKRINFKNVKTNMQPLRVNYNSYDTIQSPQPSGLPSVAPSPDMHQSKSKNVFLEQLLCSSSRSPQYCHSETPVIEKGVPIQEKLQKEPLDLGIHRKSASPTVSCSEEVKRVPIDGHNDDNRKEEHLYNRFKYEEHDRNADGKSRVDNFIEMLSTGRNTDPLMQLRLLVCNPEWKVPDPILVPKERLSAVLTSPAKEIPLLLTTRPELRLPEAFAYPSILQDPDILVISMAQLEAILQKQAELTRIKGKTSEINIESKVPNAKDPDTHQRIEEEKLSVNSKLLSNASIESVDSSKNISNSETEMNTSLAAFNQVLWLPYLGQIAPDIFKTIAGITTVQNTKSLNELLSFLRQQNSNCQQSNKHKQKENPNPLEIAMWREALTQAQIQRLLKLNATVSQHKSSNKIASDCKSQNNNREQLQTHEEIADKIFSTTRSVPNPFYRHQKVRHLENSAPRRVNKNPGLLHDQKPRVTCKSLSNLLPPDRLQPPTDRKLPNLVTIPSLDFTINNSFGNFNNVEAESYNKSIGIGICQPQDSLTAMNTELCDSAISNISTCFAKPVSYAASPKNKSISTFNSQNSAQQAKLKVKPGSHLIDPVAVKRRLISYDEMTEVGSSINGLEDIIADPSGAYWHPLFGNSQKPCYTSPWQWTTVTATGE